MILLSLTPDGTSGIPGDSVIAGHEKWISCQSISLDVTREADESKDDQKKLAGKKDVFVGLTEANEISIAKSVDCASGLLMHYAASGVPVPTTGKIHFLISGQEQKGATENLILEIIIEHPVISDWSLNADEDARPAESVKIRYDKISLKYWQFDGKRFTGTTPKGWDMKLAKSWSGGNHA